MRDEARSAPLRLTDGWLMLRDDGGRGRASFARWFAGHVWEGEESPGWSHCWAFTCDAPTPHWISHVCTLMQQHSGQQLPTGCERTPYGHIYAVLASADIPLRSCMEMCMLNTLRPWLAAGCSIIRNNIWLFHIQNSYLSSLRECNEQWRLLGACQQFSTTCVRCDILHEAFCRVSLHGTENPLKSS